MRSRTCLLVFASLLGSGANADFVDIDLTGAINANLRAYTNGGAYPVGGGVLDAGGVPFATYLLGGDPNTLGIFQTSQNSALLDVDIDGGYALYALVASVWGTYGATVGSVEIFGKGSGYQKSDLIEGVNIRDHYNGSYNNVVAPNTTTLNFGSGVRLDRMDVVLDAQIITEGIDKIVLNGTGGRPQGAPLFASVTVEAVPEPGTLAVLGLGLAAASRKRRK